MEKLKMESVHMTQKNIESIGALFPNVITEMRDEDGKLKKGINFDLLKQELSGEVIDGEECYDFSWVGKKASIVEGNTPIRKTLRPYIEENESKNWEHTSNLFFEGDNLEVLKLLQESYLNSIKMIYIDPPYNTGNDSFVYPDNYTMNEDEYKEMIQFWDEEGNQLFKPNYLTNPRFHSDWCSMMYPRLNIAKRLMAPDGIICMQIDDNEVDNLKKIADQIFGEANYMTTIVVKMSEATGMKMAHANVRIPKLKEYILVYKNGGKISLNNVNIPKEKWDSEYKTFLMNITKEEVQILKKVRDNEERTLNEIKICDEILSKVNYSSLLEQYKKRGIDSKDKMEEFNFDNAWRIVQTVSMTGGAKDLADKKRATCKSVFYSIQTSQKKMYLIKGDYSFDISKPRIKILFADDYLTVNPCDFWQDIKTTGLDNEGYVDFRNGKKPLKLIQRLIRLFTSENDLILDFFAGSGTTAHAVLDINAEDYSNNSKRKFILVQLPENLDEQIEKADASSKRDLKEMIDFLDSIQKPHLLSEIAKERIRRSGEKIKSDIGKNNAQLKIGEETKIHTDIGFRVFKVDSTNMKDVYYGASEYSQDMLAGLESNIKDDRTDLDLLYGVLLDWGLPLSLSHKTEEIDGVSVHTVDEGSLVACFADRISENVVREIAKRQPLRVVFRDSSFANSPDKINVEEIFKLNATNTTVKVI